MVVVDDFAVVKNGKIKETNLTVANTAYKCIVVIHLLLTGKRFHFTVLLEMLDYCRLPLVNWSKSRDTESSFVNT